MMMCDIFLDSLDMYLDVVKILWSYAYYRMRLLSTRQISFRAKNYRIFYDLKYANKLPHLDPVYEKRHEKWPQKWHEIRYENSKKL